MNEYPPGNELMEMFEGLSKRLDHVEGRLDDQRQVLMKGLEGRVNGAHSRINHAHERIDTLECNIKGELDRAIDRFLSVRERRFAEYAAKADQLGEGYKYRLDNHVGRILELERRLKELEEGGKREPGYVENSSAVVLLRLGEGDHSSRAVYEFDRVKEVRVDTEKVETFEGNFRPGDLILTITGRMKSYEA